MRLLELDEEMNNLMERFELDDTTEEEKMFLVNVCTDLIELLIDKGEKSPLLKVKYLLKREQEIFDFN